MKTDSNFNFYTNIIGKGVTFPIQLTTNEKGETGWYPSNGSFEQVKNSMSALLWYMIGQRFRQEDFGTRLWECIEEPNTNALESMITTFLEDAFTKWEDRITISDIETARSGTKLYILVTYYLVGTSTSQYIYITYDKSNNTLI